MRKIGTTHYSQPRATGTTARHTPQHYTGCDEVDTRQPLTRIQ